MSAARISDLGLVVLVGPSGGGKSTLARTLFAAEEILSSDALRGELLGDPQRQDANAIVFAELLRRAELRLSLGRRVVLDATHLRARDRAPVLALAERFGIRPDYLIVDRPLEAKQATAGWRKDVKDGRGRPLVEAHAAHFAGEERRILDGDGGRARVIDARRDDIEVTTLPRRAGLAAELRTRHGGLLLVGDVHGELAGLEAALEVAAREGLMPVFLGDVVDYGGRNLATFDRLRQLVAEGRAQAILGNHEEKLQRWASRKLAALDAGAGWDEADPALRVTDGLAATLAELERLPLPDRTAWLRRAVQTTHALTTHLRDGNLVAVHGAAHPSLFEEHLDARMRLPDGPMQLALYGEVDRAAAPRPDGLPKRVYGWVDRLPQRALAVVGHDIRQPTPLIASGRGGGRAVFLDTGHGKGGPLHGLVVPFGADATSPIRPIRIAAGDRKPPRPGRRS